MQSGQILEDKSLVLDFISGSDEAFRKIFELYHLALYRRVIRFVKSPDYAADIVQDVFIKVLENRKSIDPAYSFTGFLFTIAKNQVLNFLKRAAKEKSIREEFHKFATEAHTQHEDTIIYNDLSVFADRAIECLPPQRRLVFKLFKDEGKDYHEIAENLGISKNTVRDHLAKASKFVRGYLEAHADMMSILLFITFYF